MKTTVISSNDKRKTAMITIVHDEGIRKRSETRHCKKTDKGLVGRMLDQHCDALTKMQAISELWARQIDSLNAELGNKAKKAVPYNASLFFAWEQGDCESKYIKYLGVQRDRATQISEGLWEEGEQLESLAIIRRAEKAAKQKKGLVVAKATV